ncbi:MAG: hypothetical protein AABY22_30520 [Nanoarchaeota archaeon]
MTKNKYNVDFFIEKFRQIPEDKWITKTYSDGEAKCALGHCGYGYHGKTTKMGKSLLNLFYENKLAVVEINDGLTKKFLQKTPKTRIMAALNFIKKKNSKKGLE